MIDRKCFDIMHDNKYVHLIKFIFRLFILIVPVLLIIGLLSVLVTGGIYAVTRSLFDDQITNHILFTITLIVIASHLIKKRRGNRH